MSFRSIYIIIGVVFMSIVVASCGKQYSAKGLAEDFIEKNAVAPEKMLYREYSDLGTTTLISDSVILSMQQRGHELFKRDIEYSSKSSGNLLYYLRMKYVYEGDTLQQTFYLDENLTQIVSFK